MISRYSDGDILAVRCFRGFLFACLTLLCVEAQQSRTRAEERIDTVFNFNQFSAYVEARVS